MGTQDELPVQAFQNAICNWRCWYCFVDFALLSGSRKWSDWKSAEELIQLYLNEMDPPRVIDLTGGQPDLTPEWVPWMMQALRKYKLHDSVYLWSDDNLSNDYFFRYLSCSDRALIAEWPLYGRVGCFKGFDEQSFSFNTLAKPSLFHSQFQIFKDLLETGIDLYAYATFTSPNSRNVSKRMRKFIDCLQAIHHNLPLRTVPLEVSVFSPTQTRMDEEKERALCSQYQAIDAWLEELSNRFSEEERTRCVCEVELSVT